jgi:hypothetical protein
LNFITINFDNFILSRYDDVFGGDFDNT